MAGVSSRTRSRNVPLFGSIPFHGSCVCSLKFKHRKSDMGLSSKKRKSNEKPFVLHEDVICIDSDKEGDQEGLKYSDKKLSEACVEQVENIDGDADEVDDIDVKNEEQSGDIVDIGGEGGLEDCEMNSFEGCVYADGDDNGDLSFPGSCLLKSKGRKSVMGLSSKKGKPNEESFVLHEDADVIRIGSDEEGDEEGLKFCDKNFSQIISEMYFRNNT